MAGAGDMLPHEVFRHLQLGDDDPVRALQPWLCVGCQTCAARCPQELDLSVVMDAIRSEAIRRGTVPPDARRMAVFNKVFLEQVLAGGRLKEVELAAMYNLRARDPFRTCSHCRLVETREDKAGEGRAGSGVVRRGRGI
jgi:heterodisulfide reductase subunit C